MTELYQNTILIPCPITRPRPCCAIYVGAVIVPRESRNFCIVKNWKKLFCSRSSMRRLSGAIRHDICPISGFRTIALWYFVYPSRNRQIAPFQVNWNEKKKKSIDTFVVILCASEFFYYPNLMSNFYHVRSWWYLWKVLRRNKYKICIFYDGWRLYK